MGEDIEAILATDPLGVLARKERKALLIMSVIALAMATGGLVPSEISLLGIKAAAIKPSAILRLIALVVLYFLVSFLMHAFPDFTAWWARYKKWTHELQVDAWDQEDKYGPPSEQGQPQPSEEFLKSFRGYARPHMMARRMALIRAFALDLIIPYLIGVVTLSLTVTAALT